MPVFFLLIFGVHSNSMFGLNIRRLGLAGSTVRNSACEREKISPQLASAAAL